MDDSSVLTPIARGGIPIQALQPSIRLMNHVIADNNADNVAIPASVKTPSVIAISNNNPIVILFKNASTEADVTTATGFLIPVAGIYYFCALPGQILSVRRSGNSSTLVSVFLCRNNNISVRQFTDEERGIPEALRQSGRTTP